MRRAILFALFFATTVLIADHERSQAAGFAWEDGKNETTLTYDGRPVLRYMRERLDESSPEARERTIKPFHHVFSPDGETLLTKGPGGLYTHHRGLFFGFNKIKRGDDPECDVWHCRNGESQQHVQEMIREADDDSARQRVAIEWRNRAGDVFANEEREYLVRRKTIDGVDGWLIDFSSHVASADGQPIHLDGDPQHAGFHFRAAQEDIKNDKEDQQNKDKQAYFLRTDGKGQIFETRNWDEKKPADDETVNRPWNAMSFLLHGKRYTVLYLDHPSNPKPARYSERAYGRFGSYFVADITKDMPLNVKYRVWAQPGEMAVEQCEKLSADFNAENTVLPVSEVEPPHAEPLRTR
jgi:hypothetical protein